MQLTSWLRRQKRWMLVVAVGTTCQLGCYSSTQFVDYFRSAVSLLAADISTQLATPAVRTVFPDPAAATN